MASEEAAIAHEEQLVESFKYSKRVALISILGRGDGGLGLVGKRAVVGGWVKSSKERAKPGAPRPSPVVVKGVTCSEIVMSRIPGLRSIAKLLLGESVPLPAKPDAGLVTTVPAVAHLRINDGSCVANLQILVGSSLSPLGQIIPVGTSILVEGVIEQPSIRGKRAIELKVDKILHVGIVDSKKYPLAKSRLPLEFIRAYPHLRPRTTTVACINRIRSTLSYSIHLFFQSNGFFNVHMPVITTTNSGLHNKAFQVTTLFSKPGAMEMTGSTNDQEAIHFEVVKASIKEKSNRIEELKRSDSNKEALVAAVQDLRKANELALKLEEQQKTNPMMVKRVDFSKDFFSCQAYLSFSAGLHLESYACSLSSVYAFGPIFQADDSQSMKHLAEMWIVEVELAFAEIEDVMNCAEDCIKFLCESILKNCSNNMKFISKRIDSSCIDRIRSVGSSPFARITYTKALEVLKKATDRRFETKVEWGIGLSKEHESYLVDEVYKRPLIIYDYPKEVKPFYVRIRDDGRTVSAFDVIAPKVGVLIQGSQREERLDMIITRIEELGLPREQYEWYLDLRRHGTVKHSGFSLGFEGMVMFATGLDDIKDSVPFPRARGYANI